MLVNIGSSLFSPKYWFQSFFEDKINMNAAVAAKPAWRHTSHCRSWQSQRSWWWATVPWWTAPFCLLNFSAGCEGILSEKVESCEDGHDCVAVRRRETLDWAGKYAASHGIRPTRLTRPGVKVYLITLLATCVGAQTTRGGLQTPGPDTNPFD